MFDLLNFNLRGLPHRQAIASDTTCKDSTRKTRLCPQGMDSGQPSRGGELKNTSTDLAIFYWEAG